VDRIALLKAGGADLAEAAEPAISDAFDAQVSFIGNENRNAELLGDTFKPGSKIGNTSKHRDMPLLSRAGLSNSDSAGTDSDSNRGHVAAEFLLVFDAIRKALDDGFGRFDGFERVLSLFFFDVGPAPKTEGSVTGEVGHYAFAVEYLFGDESHHALVLVEAVKYFVIATSKFEHAGVTTTIGKHHGDIDHGGFENRLIEPLHQLAKTGREVCRHLVLKLLVGP